MKYKLMLSATLLALLFAPLSGKAAKVEIGGDGEVVNLNRDCFECLVNCAKNRHYGPRSFEDCTQEVCHDLCKTK